MFRACPPEAGLTLMLSEALAAELLARWEPAPVEAGA